MSTACGHGCCLFMFEIYFLSQPDIMLCKFVNNTARAHGHEKLRFNTFLLGVELVKDAVMFLWKVILVVGDVV